MRARPQAATAGAKTKGWGGRRAPGGPRTGSKPMDRRPVGASRWLRLGLICLAATVAVLTVMTDPADARHRRKRYHAKRVVESEAYRPNPRVQAARRAVENSNPRYDDVVMDAKTGELLHQSSPD